MQDSSHRNEILGDFKTSVQSPGQILADPNGFADASAAATAAEPGWGGISEFIAGMNFKALLSWKCAFVTIAVGAIGCLMWLALYLSAMRIYQVDECTNVYVARVLATGSTSCSGDLFQILLSRILSVSERATELYSSARLVMVVLFWLNWMLMASATGERILSFRWLVALCGAITLAPVWDYGFEARHDNVLLSGVLFIWALARFQPARCSVYFVVGACSVVLQFVAFKAFVYVGPLSAALLIFPRPGNDVRRWKLFLAWGAGAVGGYLMAKWIGNSVGLGYNGSEMVENVASVPSTITRFWPWKIALPRLLTQTPLLLALSVSGLFAMVIDIIRRRKAVLTWDGYLPEGVMLLIAVMALFVNPNPYPYNLLHLVPYLFIFSYRYLSSLVGYLQEKPSLFPAVAGVLIFAHLVPFWNATQRHLKKSNIRQEAVMCLAEDFTDPIKDPVFDGSGFVATRPVIHPASFIHGQSVKNLIHGDKLRIRSMLAENPASVIIPSYRTDWLPDADHEFIKEHYVSLADDFWVLGKVLPVYGGELQILHSGRYRISSLEASDIAGTYPDDLNGMLAPELEGRITGRLNGVTLTNQVVELNRGSHHIESTGDTQIAVVWVGPSRNRPHRQSQGNHSALFCNWY